MRPQTHIHSDCVCGLIFFNDEPSSDQHHTHHRKSSHMPALDPAGFDPTAAFEEFYSNPSMIELGKQRLWTISDSDKRPIDVANTLEKISAAPRSTCSRCGWTDCSRVHGAQLTEADTQLLTLDELTKELPTAANTAIHIDTMTMAVMVLDIEPNCPPAIADALLRLVTGSTAEPTTALYHELSGSGQGYHILMPIPHIAASMPGVLSRTKIQHPKRYYEILFRHWITFSRNPIPSERLAAAQSNPDGDLITWDEVFSTLYRQLPAAPAGLDSEIDILEAIAATRADLTELESSVLASTIAAHRQHWYRDLDTEFHGDTSRWEYAQAIKLAHLVARFYDEASMLEMLCAGQFGQPAPIESDRRVALVHLALLEVLPYRNKHDEFRSGMPYLLKRATSAVAGAPNEFGTRPAP